MISTTPLTYAATRSSVNVLTSATGINSGANTLVISKPEAVLKDSLLVAQIAYEKGISALPIKPPVGWTAIIQNNGTLTNANKDFGQCLYFKIASANEPTSYTWTFSSTVKAIGGITQFSGASVDQPILAFGGQSGFDSRNGINQMDTTSLRSVAGARLVSFYGIQATSLLDVPKEMDRIYEDWDLTNGYSILSAQGIVEDTGTTGMRSSFSWQYDKRCLSIQAPWVAQMIAIKPSTIKSVTPPQVVQGSSLISTPEITVYINGTPLSLTDKPFLSSGRTLVPMRAFFEALGASVYWDSETQTAIAIENTTEVRIPIGSTKPKVNNIETPIDVAASIVSGRTYIPLRFVSEALGAEVFWEPSTKIIYINH
jgi:hypothetical protein